MNGKTETTPHGKTALKVGVSSVITATVLGIGSLAYYSFGFSSQLSALDKIKSGAWSAQIKRRLQAIYTYLFFSFYICVVSAILVFCHPTMFKIFSSPPMVIVDFLVHTIMQNGKTLARIDNRGIVSKQRVTWVFYCAFLGAVASPVFLLGVKTARTAVHMTCVLVSLLVILSLTAPVGKFVTWKQGLSMSEIAIFVASIGAAVFPITSTAGAIFFAVSFYGGLIMYPISFLCHSQQAQVHASEESATPFCSVAASVPMLMDVISIFSRVVILVPP